MEARKARRFALQAPQEEEEEVSACFPPSFLPSSLWDPQLPLRHRLLRQRLWAQIPHQEESLYN